MKKQRGITLIALIITIIVMLILVGVTINFALNGGIINKAKQASIQTEIAIIQEQLMFKKAEILADNMGSVPENGYGLSSVSDLDGLSQEIISKYNSKLIISPDGTLYYLENQVTSEEKVYFGNAGITAYQATQNNEDSTSEDPNQLTPKAWGTASALIIRDSDNNLYIVENDTVSTLSSTGMSLINCYITDFGTFSSDTMEIFNDSSVHMDLITVDTSAKYDILLNNNSPYDGGPFLAYIPSSDSWNSIGTHDGYVYVFDSFLASYSGDISNFLTQIEAMNNGN